MGIKNLSKIIKELNIQKIKNINDLKGKTIVIDTSFFIYKSWYIILMKEFKKKNIMIEELSDSNLINKFIYYLYGFIKKLYRFDIDPIFVFDGKPPNEKFCTLFNRKNIREKSFQNFIRLKTTYKEKEENMKENNNLNEESMNSLESIKTEAEKKYLQASKIPMHNLRISMKLFLTGFGIEYYEAKEEADKLCSLLVIKKKADAVFSSDTDNLVIGCPLLITEIKDSLVKIIELEDILNKLNMDHNQFKLLCILSGCDYNKNIPHLGFKKLKKKFEMLDKDLIKMIENLKKDYGEENINNLQIDKCMKLYSSNDNLDSIIENCNLVKKINFEQLEKILELFNIKF